MYADRSPVFQVCTLYSMLHLCMQHTLFRLPGTFSLSEAATVSSALVVAGLRFGGVIVTHVAHLGSISGLVAGLLCGAAPNLYRAWLPRWESPVSLMGGEVPEEGSIPIFVSGLLTCCILNGVALVPWCVQRGGSPRKALPARRGGLEFLTSTGGRFFLVWMPIVQLLTGNRPPP